MALLAVLGVSGAPGARLRRFRSPRILIASRGVVQIPDALGDPAYGVLGLVQAVNYRSILAVPLLRDGHPIGVIAVPRAQVGSFPTSHIALLETFARQAVIAIENVGLFEAEQKRARELAGSLQQQTATSEVLRVISSSPGELKPVFEAMLASAMRICEANFGHLLLYDGESYHAAHLHNLPAGYHEIWKQGPIRPSPELVLGQLPHTKQAIQIADLRAEPLSCGTRRHDEAPEIRYARFVGGDTDMVVAIG